MNIVTQYYNRKFKSDSKKDAYMKAVKWQATMVLKDEVLKDTFMKIVEMPTEDDLFVYKLELYASIDEKESRESFCNACRQFHKSFFINEQYNCDKCNMIARSKQVEGKLLIKKEYRKERLKQSIGRNTD